ncbi:hypothetical protein [Streptomyces atroolivaceus]|uniref:Uncharacterized protein n=1 Tax=Streptomyces atroolivaceus TaxID=66869 RepID=A0ABV9V656_STRAZ|nr:hypothetical protein [Streptomyces atroolivaceus]
MQRPQASSAPSEALVAAFPARLAEDVRAVLPIMPDARVLRAGPLPVEVEGVRIALPSRIHHDEPGGEPERSLTGTQQVILHCLYSRHHDGRVRQRRLGVIVGSSEPWVVPFVVQLAGEYVVEILETILHGLTDLGVPGSCRRKLYGEFVARNPSYFARTERRMVSYWSCHHRRQFPEFGTYPGGILAEALRSAASEQAGMPWPRQTPRPRTAPGGRRS